jgi:DNA-binding transcriptional ArsR family regulator
MSKSKSVERQAERFKALGNPHRLAVFQRLLNCCAPGTACSAGEASTLCVGDLGRGLDIAPSTLSHHLRELARAGLVRTARRGKSVECWVEPDVLEELASFFATPLNSGGKENE